MRRILFLLTLTCVAIIATDLFAQQCCSRRPLFGRGLSTQGCCTQFATTTQTLGAVNDSPINLTTAYSTASPMSATTCCSPTGQPISSGSIVATEIQGTQISNVPHSSVSGIPVQGSFGSLTSQIPGAALGTPLPTQTQTEFPYNTTASLYSPAVTSANTIVQPAPQSYPAISSNFSTVQPVVSTNVARPSYFMPTYTQTSMRLTQQYSSQQYSSGGLAQRKAQRAAQMGLRGHLGGSLGGARYEGVGWSNISPQSAIQNCCYWGQRPASQIGVARGNDGSWYACVLYR